MFGLLKHEMELAAGMLKEYSERLTNDSCNDWNFPDNWTKEQKFQFTTAYHMWAKSPQDEWNHPLTDWMVAKFLAQRCKTETSHARKKF